MRGGRRALLVGALAAPVLRPSRARAAQRIVVAGGGLAEILVALGLEAHMVGVDSTALFPARLRALPQIGYLRNLSAEGVLSLNPDLLVLAHEAGPPPVVARLAATGVPVYRAPRIQSPEELLLAVEGLSAATGADGASVIAALRADLAAVQAAVPRPPSPPRALFVLAAGGAPQASGTGTAAAAMITLAGARTAIAAYSGYRPLSAEAALSVEPDWIVTTTQAVEARGGARAFLADPSLRLLAAAREGRLAALDALYLLGFGPRLAHAVRDLAALLHGRALPPLPERPWVVGA
ncbi:MAG: ABC transporter substrate-binding protein [Rhodovarius sp.]|nr:ABC transporter substrate-binding protein [Acetobacteraceae bacterium]MCX7933516.1 ABC transporter substrate-binding protein [Rhodovarius sp.]MDW8314304.1 ABC transporter substrate-binding protein [Rhodovarius sp.]